MLLKPTKKLQASRMSNLIKTWKILGSDFSRKRKINVTACLHWCDFYLAMAILRYSFSLHLQKQVQKCFTYKITETIDSQFLRLGNYNNKLYYSMCSCGSKYLILFTQKNLCCVFYCKVNLLMELMNKNLCPYKIRFSYFL